MRKTFLPITTLIILVIGQTWAQPSTDFYITGNYSKPVTAFARIKPIGQTTIVNTANCTLDFNPVDGYVEFLPVTNSDFFLAAPESIGAFTAVALSGYTPDLPAISNNFPTAEFDPETAFTELSIYPNPTTGIATASHPREVKQLFLYNAMGELIMQKNNSSNDQTRLDLSALPAGAYWLRLDKQKTIKIIKE